MGSSQSLLSGEAALTVLVVAGALGLGYTQISGGRVDTQQTEKEKGKGRGKAKGKKSDKKSAAAASDASVPSTPPTVLQDAIPGQFDALQPVQPSPAPKSKKSKKKKTKAASSATTTNAGTPPAAVSSPTLAIAEAYNSESSTSAVPISGVTTRAPRTTKQSTTSIDTDGSWTRVEPRHRNYLAAAQTATTTTSDVATTTASSSPVAERMEEEEEDEEEGAHSSFLLNSNTRDEESRRRTLAEKLLPKPRKSSVDEYVLSFPPLS